MRPHQVPGAPSVTLTVTTAVSRRAVDLHKMFPIEEKRPEVYRLDVRLSDGARESVQFGADRQMPGEPRWMRTQVIGGSDVDGDGLREIFVSVGHGASTGFVSAFRWLNHDLEQLRLDGRP